MKILMALTSGSELVEETGYLNGRWHRRMETNPPPWAQSPPHRNRCCHCTTISLGEQQVYVIKRQVLVIMWQQHGHWALFCGNVPYWQEMHEVSWNVINRNTFFFFPQCCRHQLSNLGQSRMSRSALPASFRINHGFSISNFNLAFSPVSLFVC